MMSYRKLKGTNQCTERNEMTDQERIRLFHDSLQTRNFTMLMDRKIYAIRDYLPLKGFRSGYTCKPCKRCYKQETPIFDPKSSFTYSKLPCLHQECYDKFLSKCDTTDNTCPYTTKYADGGYSTGYLSTDTITTYRENGNVAQYPEIVFGCGNYNVFTVNGNGMDPPGIIGLNTHVLSFVTQLGARFFSFCLPQRKGLLGPRRNNAIFHRSYSNSLRFGRAALIQGEKTPMINVQGFYKPQYVISFNGVSFGPVRVSAGRLFMLLDTGSSVSSLPEYIYDKLIDDMRKKIQDLFIVEIVKEMLCVKAST
ncbi:hypothetical protein MKX03_021130 [Papaver bracteatum]|nr:hypothetical protein MKX03_021130 [Papaver bracteatum]